MVLRDSCHQHGVTVCVRKVQNEASIDHSEELDEMQVQDWARYIAEKKSSLDPQVTETLLERG